jgi:hypothetical protein
MALTGFTDGWTGDYLRFNGTTSIAKTSVTNLTVKCLEIYCKLHSLPTYYANLILTMTSAANSNLAIYERNSGTVKGITGNHCSTALANIYSNVLPNLEQLYHIILQFTGTAVEIWVDGVLKTTLSTTATVIAANFIQMGASADATPKYFANMSMKVARAYNRGLTPSEIADNYADAIATSVDVTITPPAATTYALRLPMPYLNLSQTADVPLIDNMFNLLMHVPVVSAETINYDTTLAIPKIHATGRMISPTIEQRGDEMNKVIHLINLNISGLRPYANQALPLWLYRDDTGLHTFKMSVYDDLTPVTMEGVDRATVTFLRADGAVVVDECTIDYANNLVSYDIPNSVTQVPGIVTFTVEFYMQLKRITSNMCKFKAIEDLDEGDEVSNDPQYPVLMKLIADMQGLDTGDGSTGTGIIPAHRWVGTSLQFQNADGTWGQLIDLKGDDGTDGTGTGTVSEIDGGAFTDIPGEVIYDGGSFAA